MLFTLITLFAFTVAANAQKGRMHHPPTDKECGPAMLGERMFERLPDLTDTQKDKIGELRTEHLKATLPIKNEMAEKRAELRSLQTAENVDTDAVNKKIEAIGALHIKMMKKRAAHHQEIRNLLTEEQRVIFDSRFGRHKGRRHGPGKRF